jgi:hypothetical protein
VDSDPDRDRESGCDPGTPKLFPKKKARKKCRNIIFEAFSVGLEASGA